MKSATHVLETVFAQIVLGGPQNVDGICGNLGTSFASDRKRIKRAVATLAEATLIRQRPLDGHWVSTGKDWPWP